MARRFDLIEMFELPEKFVCNTCKKVSYPHGLGEYSEEIQFVGGKMEVEWYCPNFECPPNKVTIMIQVRVQSPKNHAPDKVRGTDEPLEGQALGSNLRADEGES